MNQPARMWKTLASLVVAMTGTAMLLSWMDPSAPVVPPTGVSADLTQHVRSIVLQRVALNPELWYEIEIASAVSTPMAGLHPAVAGSLLAAPVPVEKHHFFVKLDGGLIRTSAWESQQFARNAPQTVRVAVVRRSGHAGMSPQQLVSVRELIDRLNSEICTQNAPLRVRLDPYWRRVYGIDEEIAQESANPRLQAPPIAST